MPAPGPSPSALVGRDRELALLRERLADALAGNGSLVLIGGEAGIGKTALAAVVCREAEEGGATVLIGRCFDLTETPPYGPWIELFGPYHPGSGLPALPDAFARRGTVGAVESQATLFRQVQDFLAALAAQRPLVLLLDDLHWADPASLDLLRVVGRDLAAHPVLIIVTYRSDELTRRHALYQLLPVLVREAPAARIDLHPIGHGDIRALVTARYAPSEADADRLVGYLHARSEGNPFFLAELLRTLEAERALDRTATGWAVGDLARIRVPMLLRQVLDGRFARLGGEALRLLTVAAVIGQEVSLAVWAAVTDADGETLAAAVERAMDAHLVDTSADGTGVHFAHALIREALYEGIIPVRRGAWHRLVGDYLLTQPAPDPDTIADHLRRAGDARAAYWLAKAGERAERAYAWLTAIERYEAALGLMGGASPDTGERGWLLYRLARMVRYSDPQRGLLYLDEAAREAAQSGDAALWAATIFSRGVLRCYADDFRQGIPDLESGVEAIGALSPADTVRIREDAGMKGDARGTLVVFLANVGRLEEACAVGERLIGEAPDAAGGDVHQGLRTAYALLGRPDDARVAFHRARALYRATEHFTILGVTILNQIDFVALPYRADDLAERARLVEECARAYRRASGAWAEDPSRWARLPLLLVEGAWEEAEQAALSWLASGSYRSAALSILGPLARQRGDRKAAWGWVSDGIPAGLATVPGEALFIDTVRLQRLAIALATEEGDLAAAQAWLAAHDRWLAWSQAALGRADGQVLWAQYHRQSGDTGRASGHAQRALVHASEPRQPLALLAVHRLLGELATDAGRFDDASTHLRASLALADACAAPFERALTLLALAELYAATDKQSEAGVLAGEVRTICAPLGATPTLERAEALVLRAAGVKGTPPAYPAGLSAREVEVLRLVAAGRSNREIAEALFLSPGTINIHVNHILTKTNTANRTEAAAFAHRHGLA